MAQAANFPDEPTRGAPAQATPVASAPALVQATPVALALAPVSAGERLAVIDILRGVALLGILVENMLFFGGPVQLWEIYADWWPRPVDQAVIWLIAWLEQGKMYSLFAFLFGVGTALQGQRVGARGGDPRRLYLRRMFVLLLFGVAHITLLWWGDILALYAVMGFVLWPMQRQSERRLLRWAVFLWALPIVVGGALAVLATVGTAVASRISPTSGPASDLGAVDEVLQAVRHSAAIYAQGSFGEIFVQRLRDTGTAWLGTIPAVPGILLMMVLGVYAGRRGIFERLDEHRLLVRRLLWWGLPLGLLCHLGEQLVSAAPRGAYGEWADFASYALFALGTPAATLGYAAAIVVLLQKRRIARVLAPLAAAGEMSLTNYLLQSIVCTTLFYGYGFALFGKVGPLLGLVPTVVIYVVQVGLSVWWLGRFRFGPLEWVWRTLTYGRVQPMRRRAG